MSADASNNAADEEGTRRDVRSVVPTAHVAASRPDKHTTLVHITLETPVVQEMQSAPVARYLTLLDVGHQVSRDAT